MILSAAACQNLGPREARKRKLFGYLFINVGLVLAVVFIWQDAADWIRVLVFIPFFLGYLGVLQSIQKTCVLLTASGMQNHDAGPQPQTDPLLQRKLKVRSIWIILLSAILALIFAYLTLAIRTEHMVWPQGPPGG